MKILKETIHASTPCSLEVPLESLFSAAETMLQPGRQGTIRVILPQKAKETVIIAAGAAVAVKLFSVTADHIREHRQNRRLKRLNSKVDELEERVRKLEKTV